MSADNVATPETVERAVEDAGGLPDELGERITLRLSEERLDELEAAVERGRAATVSDALREAAREWVQGGGE